MDIQEPIYIAPLVKLVELKTRSIICTSQQPQETDTDGMETYYD